MCVHSSGVVDSFNTRSQAFIVKYTIICHVGRNRKIQKIKKQKTDKVATKIKLFAKFDGHFE